MKTVAVIPAYKEQGRIGAVVKAAAVGVAAVVVVDDASPDATAAEARAAGALVVQHAVNRGQGAALKTGTAAALSLGAEIIIHLDADGQHDPADLPRLLAPLIAGEADFVSGSRFLEAPSATDGTANSSMPPARRWLLRAAHLFSRLILGVPPGFTDPQSGLRAMTADAARRLDFRQDRMAHCSEILMLLTKSGLRWREVSVTVRYSADTLAKGQKASDALKIVWQLILGALE
jgi:polyprenyl-phospho-N-acetylgalactosaminyl synthase